jgi:hypothetical protein
MVPILPIGQGALVHAEEFLAFVRRHLQVKPVLLDLFANVAGFGRIMACFP